MGRRKQLLKRKQKKSSICKNERIKRPVEGLNAPTNPLSYANDEAEKDVKRRKYDDSNIFLFCSDSESESSDIQVQKAKELNIMNNSLTRLYQSHGHPSVTAAVTPVQRSDNTLAMPSPPGTAKLDDDIEKVTFPPCSPKLECKEPHIDSSQSIKEVAESMGDHVFVTALTTAATENTLVGQATESSCEGQDVHKASSTASVIASNVVPHNPNTTSQDGILDDSTLRSDELHLKKSGRISKRKKNIQATREAEITKFVLQKSTVTLKDVGGIDHCLQEIDNLVMHFKHPKLFEHLGVVPIKGFLLYGPPGCGKTLLVHAIAGELDIPYIELAGTEIVKGVSGESENTLRRLFQQAKSNAPCILFLDDIDAICPKRETAQREMERRIVSQLLSCFNDLSDSTLQHHVLVIGTTNHLDSLDSALRSAGRFEKEVSLGVPDEKARKKILEVMCRNLRLEDGFDHVTLAHATPGFVGGDLTLLVKEAAMVAIQRILKQQQEADDGSISTSHEGLTKMDSEVLSEQIPSNVCITNDDFKQALTTVQPSAKREGFASVPDATWDDIGALDHIKEELALCILAPVHHPEHFESLGLTTPTGVLLIGPPGCGKTLLAKAVANESGINFISVKGPELLNMYVGESEKAVRQVFQKARDSAPCVIFFDELDSLCPRRSESREGHSSARVVNQLLTEMDGMQSRRQVFVMAATNRPDILDGAVLRPGRLDKTLHIGLPTAEERAVILKTITKKKPSLAPDVELDVIAKDERCEGFSGADLSALVKEAAITALKETLPMVSLLYQRDNASNPQQPINTVVKQSHFITALSKITPSVSKEDQVRYQKMAKQMSSNFH